MNDPLDNFLTKTGRILLTTALLLIAIIVWNQLTGCANDLKGEKGDPGDPYLGVVQPPISPVAAVYNVIDPNFGFATTRLVNIDHVTSEEPGIFKYTFKEPLKTENFIITCSISNGDWSEAFFITTNQVGNTGFEVRIKPLSNYPRNVAHSCVVFE